MGSSPPKVGTRPIIDFTVRWLGVGPITVKVLLDTGAAVALLSEDFVRRFQVPKVKRDVPLYIYDVAGRIVEGSGQAFTFPLLLQHKEHVTTETFEIAPVDKGCDVVLPYWWIARHRPSGLWEGPSHLTFDSKFCREKCSESEAESFSIEYDESLLDYCEDPSAVGFIGTIVMKDNETVINLEASVPTRYHAYLSVFSHEAADSLPPHRSFDHAIDLKPGEQPPWGPIYPLSQKELDQLREWLEDMLKSGKITPSKSPGGAPILFVPKPHGRGLRLVVDYRGLNKATVLNRYPLPLMSELRDRIVGAKIFTLIDLKSGYNLVRIKEGDEWKTAFRTRYGHYEFLVMPFGLANAPATFQNMMNDIFRDLLDHGVLVYIDDILIYSETEEEHERLVLEVLKRLKENQLAAAVDKCYWHKASVEYLGYIISGDGISMSSEKVQTVLNWQSPKCVRDVQSFLGFANFYRRFIEGFSKICRPMTDSIRGDKRNFNWSLECEEAFNELKRRFTTAPILEHYDPTLPCIIETDASDFAIGAILSQPHGKRLHPVAFMSRKMDKAELNYEIYDKEMLAVVVAFKEWRRYLEGAMHKIQVYTDHKNLEYFANAKTLNRRQARWAQELAAYDFKIIYRPGTKNGKPDALSRRPEFRPQGGAGDELQPVHRLLKPGQLDLSADHVEELVVSSARLRELPRVKFDQKFLGDIVAAGHKDPEWESTFVDLNNGQVIKNITLEDGVLYYRHRLWVPDANGLRLEVAQNDHDSKVAGHFGIDKTVELIKRNYFWPDMDKWISEYVSTCDNCQRNKGARHRRYGLLQPLELPYAPWQSISMDFIESLPLSDGCVSIWVVVDRFTKMAHFIPLKDEAKRSKDLARVFLREVWRHHGLPSDIVSDRDARFTSQFWADLTAILNIRLRMSTAFHPQTDGQTERVNQTVEAYVRAFCNHEQSDWAELLPMAEFAYNNSTTSGIGMSPFYANYGFDPQTNWPVEREVRNPASRLYSHWLKRVHDSCAEGLRKAQAQMSKYYDRKAMKPPVLKVGDKVMLNGKNLNTRRPTRKFDHKMQGPFIVEKILPSKLAYQLKLPEKWRIHNVFHVSLLEPYRQATDPSRQQPEPDQVLRDAEDIDIPDEEIYEVEAILDSTENLQTGQVKYLVKWSGYENEEDWTLEPYENMLDGEAKRMVREFHIRYPDAPRDKRVL